MTRGPRGLLLYAELVKFQHTIFALPFAIIAALLAAGGRVPEAAVAVWIVVALIGARSAAMGFNRVVDARYDQSNPRTASRPIPRGAMSARVALLFTAAAAAVFVFAAAMLNPLCFALSPAVLAILLGYSYTKRFTAWSHLVLGFSLGLAPIGAALAVTGEFGAAFRLSVLLGAAVTLWTAGFDIIYACLDVAFDKRAGLHSIPARIGVARALILSRALHAATFLLLVAFCFAAGLGVATYAGIFLAGGLLFYEQSLVRPGDLSRVGTAFFTVNGIIGLLLLAAVGADLLLR